MTSPHVDIHTILLTEYHAKVDKLLDEALKVRGVSPSPELIGRLTCICQQGVESWYLDGELLLTTCQISDVQ